MMTDNDDDPTWPATLAAWRAEHGEAALEEAQRRGIGDQILADAQEGIERAEMLELLKNCFIRPDPSTLPTWEQVSKDDGPWD
jgi:hypothetical protein